MDHSVKLFDGLQTSFVSADHSSEQSFRAQLVVNNPQSGSKVISTIETELLNCDEFSVSVAFVTMGGLAPLLQTLKELEKKNIPGKILTTDYLTFTDPKALKKLQTLKNLTVKVFRTKQPNAPGFHTKGYLFRTASDWRFIIGSANLTQTALTSSNEWNARFVATHDSEMSQVVSKEFDRLWNHEYCRPLDEVLDDYTQEYKAAQVVRRDTVNGQTNLPHTTIEPNEMQKALVENVLHLVPMQTQTTGPKTIKKGLLISATGTGKTYASAFAVRALTPTNVLFLVHREQIATQAMASYQRILGTENYTYGKFIAQERDTESNVIFSTMQTMSRHMTDFDKEHFDVIVIDEVHRAGAESYKKIMAYFEPSLWFGMTASPDRPDGEDIYALFDHMILSEIRLQKALEENLLCPFHYFGIADLLVDKVKRDKLSDFNLLTSENRIRHIVQQAEFFGYSGNRLKGLIFCSSIKEAEFLEGALNARGYQTKALSGADSQDVRLKAVERLSQDERNADALDYIISVDIFNEGVDIPDVNQVILLRQTESPIIFVQQLGRGLRKAKDKEYVIVLDFIGNYENNYMIPIALSGDRSYNKDVLRRTVSIGNRIIPGASTIHFDKVSRDRIFESINTAATNSMAILKEAFGLLKHKLGRTPKLIDFELHGSIDATKILQKRDSYYDFLVAMKSPDAGVLNAQEQEILAYLSQKLGGGQRVTEALVLECILNDERIPDLKTHVADVLRTEYGFKADKAHLDSVYRVLTNQFARNEDERKRAMHCVFLDTEIGDLDNWRAARRFSDLIGNNECFAEYIADLIEFVKIRYKKVYKDCYQDTALKLYERYTYEDVCRLLNWSRNMTAQNIGGYFYDQGTKTLPVFINYEKHEDAIAYEDRFVSEGQIVALSKTKRKTTSVDADHIYKRKEEDKDNRIYLFVRKNQDDHEAKAFYFLGEVNAQGEPTPVTVQNTQAFEIDYRLKHPVRNDIYDYLTN
ncbi:MAG: DEAD/DEAH box helicase [Sutterellaceae bacterium]|nr:DEAD/DEAH box helicase [Sutterellaceae bacterium]